VILAIFQFKVVKICNITFFFLKFHPTLFFFLQIYSILLGQLGRNKKKILQTFYSKGDSCPKKAKISGAELGQLGHVKKVNFCHI
jgi:hypothetical protein